VALVAKKMQKKGIRLIAVDRVGIGLSTFRENHTLFDTVDDVVELANHLNIEKFSVLGTSSGAKYALACAKRIPERLNAVFCLSSGVPIEFFTHDMPTANRVMLKLLQKAPWLIKPIFWLSYARLSQNSKKVDTFLGNIIYPLHKVDKELLFNTPEIKKQFALQCKESYVQGVKGNAHDAHFDMIENFWGFELEEIDFSPIYAWHGSLDRGIPLAVAKVLAERVANIEFKALEGEGHLTLVFEVLDEVLNNAKYEDMMVLEPRVRNGE
jgi:pimeloyl-ACP methyl ester carboxylesterase